MVVGAKWNIWSMQNPWLSIMINANEVTWENPYWRKILDHPCRILIVGGTISGKTNALLNLVNHHNIDKFFLYVKDQMISGKVLKYSPKKKERKMFW